MSDMRRMMMMFTRPGQGYEKNIVGVKNNTNAYIDTGIKFVVGYTYSIKFDASTIAKTNSFILGARQKAVYGAASNDNFDLFSSSPTSNFQVDIWSRYTTNIKPNSGINIFTLSSNSIIANGNILATGNKNKSGTYNIYLFSVNTNNVATSPAITTIYDFMVKDDNGDTVLHLVRDVVNDTVGFTDEITGAFYSSPNSTAFEAIY